MVRSSRRIGRTSVLEHSKVKHRPKPGIRSKSTLRDKTAHFNVYFVTTLGLDGQSIADGVLKTCETDYSRIASYFGGITPPPLPFDVFLAPLSPGMDGRGGASWFQTRSSRVIQADVDIKPRLDIDASRFLVAVEVVEVFEVAQNLGWYPGSSSGEGLSRVLGTDLYPAQLGGYATARYWLDTKTRQDYVDMNKPKDGSRVANGCAVLFLNFLRSQLNFTWNQIAVAAGSTPAQTYTRLTGLTDGFTRFNKLLEAHFPLGKSSRLNTDNPFPL